ncbi:hypothetical protein DEJ28_06455 [Curtobacterium sp. MCPF17_002]|uniref:hypothetical protein n=1 Tax=Curtobacterium sp. MCPF17_002 TaxID=2175645 RepID=UPI000DA93E72|nr:hypothetical protein [Curtobacterium sp. MCPF17_002]WIB78733.1 hypothetical protein DEJ28_06455 [Curtobacterium sp. MCPF17_002]
MTDDEVPDDDVWDRPTDVNADADADEVVTVGPWRLTLRGAEVADVQHRGVTVLRAIRFVTRDHNWRTADDTVRRRTVEVHDDSSAHVRIEATSTYDAVPVLDVVLDVSVAGGTVVVDAVGTTTRAFRRNRIGLVVLHPPTLAGTPFTVRHPFSGPTDHVFPTWIAPHQPATDVVGYTWTTGGVDVDVSLLGDGFEMEDQRNWTDASYKTYSTPLSEPFPVALEAGTTIHQSVALDCGPAGAFPPGGAASPAPALALLDGPAPTTVVTPPPTLQLLAGSAPTAARPDDAALLRDVPILVEPVLGDPNVAAVLASARRDAGGAPLDVRFVTDDPALLRAAIDAVLADGPVARVGAYDPVSHVTTPALQDALRAAAGAHGGLAAVAGTRAHFTELNRSIDVFGGWDGPLTFALTPQMHDRSRAQVTESVRMQRWVVSSASRLAAGRQLHIGPVTLRPRFNAVATAPGRVVTDPSTVDGYGPQDVPDATDPGQHSRAADDWFAASVAALTVSGVASITLAEAWGPRGVVTSDGTRSPAARVFRRP